MSVLTSLFEWSDVWNGRWSLRGNGEVGVEQGRRTIVVDAKQPEAEPSLNSAQKVGLVLAIVVADVHECGEKKREWEREITKRSDIYLVCFDRRRETKGNEEEDTRSIDKISAWCSQLRKMMYRLRIEFLFRSILWKQEHNCGQS